MTTDGGAARIGHPEGPGRSSARSTGSTSSEAPARVEDATAGQRPVHVARGPVVNVVVLLAGTVAVGSWALHEPDTGWPVVVAVALAAATGVAWWRARRPLMVFGVQGVWVRSGTSRPDRVHAWSDVSAVLRGPSTTTDDTSTESSGPGGRASLGRLLTVQLREPPTPGPPDILDTHLGYVEQALPGSARALRDAWAQASRLDGRLVRITAVFPLGRLRRRVQSVAPHVHVGRVPSLASGLGTAVVGEVWRAFRSPR
ncbi:hypothetical protein JQN72_10280 [Phycicoccus sp. CSK15P-2]|uniref:hypothetical protein n=1 Tax=Phycicoccus sp. CSK15P-2 TaxID=2807627 RepID=UPI00194F3ED3|nr:hypothetical protein [Phycicoccus sp. CSK15P-2]MBM6404627.1 hypothetical protein [Phycicoccus sp. CSK15P-2]